jgi:hypothetical protein
MISPKQTGMNGHLSFWNIVDPSPSPAHSFINKYKQFLTRGQAKTTSNDLLSTSECGFVSEHRCASILYYTTLS